jgi:uncharacterized YigZ family protein
MTEDSYLTLKEKSEGLYKEKGSKFIALAFPVQNEEEVKQHLEDAKKDYYDARHHCYAYMLGKDGEVYRTNDDGEPNHSAGDPILGQIKSNNLTFVLIIVVRYFGGTKLGVGGLINAYKTAALEAINNNTIVSETVKVLIEINFDYLTMNDIMRLIKEYDATIKEQNFDNNCRMVVEVRLGSLETFMEKLSVLQNTRAKCI